MRRTTLACAALLSLGIVSEGSTAASAQLFKCVDGGRTVYQQQACPVSAQAEPAASTTHAVAKATGASEPGAKMAARLKPASPPASSAPATPR